MAQWSALEILQQAASELGLPTPTAIPSDSVQDSQMLAMVNAAGAELVHVYPWSYLTKEWIVPIQSGKDVYKLPDDWARMLNQTGWDRKAGTPLHGPKGARTWSWLQNTQFGNPGGTRYRMMQGGLQIHPKPEATGELRFQYISDKWVCRDQTYRDSVSRSSDMPLHDAWLLIKYAKVKWLTLKGLDATQAMTEFSTMLSAMLGREGGEVLSLTGRASGVPLLGPWSVPDGNWKV